ncbi:UNVERIFIED_CONTAM: hypothetical protein GTU68_031677 [Idotea baltica]|nr:hypothetical protein [Idotea baltica]
MHAAMFSHLAGGRHVIASRALFGSLSLYPRQLSAARFWTSGRLCGGTDPTHGQQRVRPENQVFFMGRRRRRLRSRIFRRCRGRLPCGGSVLVVDNGFATPVFNAPRAGAADVVMYSTTKHIDGQGRCLGGALLGSKDYIGGKLLEFMKHTGGAMSPFNAWVMLKGLETLDLRCRAAADSAAQIAEAVAGHGAIKRAIYPGRPDHPQHNLAAAQMELPGTMVSFELQGGKAAAFKFMNALKIVRISNNLGDAKSIATHPTTTTHQRMTEDDRQALGITPGLIRLSVGLEHADDLIADITRALDTA